MADGVFLDPRSRGIVFDSLAVCFYLLHFLCICSGHFSRSYICVEDLFADCFAFLYTLHVYKFTFIYQYSITALYQLHARYAGCIKSKKSLIQDMLVEQTSTLHAVVEPPLLQKRKARPHSAGSRFSSTPYSSTTHAQNFSHLPIHSFSLSARTPFPIVPSFTSCTHSFAV